MDQLPRGTPSAERDAVLDTSGDVETIGGGVGGSATSDRTRSGLQKGRVLGRYMLLERLGAGGMGIVHAAYDSELERKVALKVLPPRGAGDRFADHRVRLIREAQALARLDHPNVVTVHDIGHADGHVYIAMELVAGITLRRWLAARRRRWNEILDVFLRAGQGLVAAHEAGLVHRDFKPDNVMIDAGVDARSARVRVMDFGLAAARETGDAPEHEDGLRRRTRPGAWIDTRVTQTGARVGTPAYMSPEQCDGQPADTRTDQFSFCVALWEGLFGVRPFVGDTLDEIVASICRGRIEDPPRGARVPHGIADALRRGLAVSPDDRWPTMRALLDVLQRRRGWVRWRRGLVGVGALAITVAGVVGWQQLERSERVGACESAGQSLASVWNDDIRGALRESLLGSGLAYAGATADGATRWIDEHADAWARARTEACLDHTVRGVWDADTYDRSVACLDERRMELQALLTELSRGGARPLERAVSAAAALAPIDACADADMLRRLPAAPAESRDAVRAIRAELSRASALQATGAHHDGLDVSRASLQQAEAIGWAPLVATAQLRVGSLLASAGDYRAAEEAQESAFFEAARAEADHIAADAANALTRTVGHDLARHAEGVRWAQMAEVWIAALPGRAGLREATRLGNLAAVHLQGGSNDEAIALFERALALEQSALGTQHPSVAGAMNNLAAALGKSGRYADARPLLEQALQIRETAQGGEHPEVAAALSNLALVHFRLGSHAQSRTLHERALAIREKVLGADHPHVATSLSGLAAVYAAQGALEESTALRERALSIREKAFGVEHPRVAASLVELASSALALRRDDAAALAERALSLRERSEAAPRLVAEARMLLARALWIAERDLPRARTLAGQGLAALREAGDAELLPEAERWAAEILGGAPPPQRHRRTAGDE